MGKNDYQRTDEPFVNPYNFVPLSGTGSPRTDIAKVREEQLFTGCLLCELETKTPLAIPDVQAGTKDGNDHHTYPAMRMNDQPVIPGSSLRGPIRAMYETLTSSCMVTMDPDQLITTRSDLGSFQPCVLKKENGTWRLYKAERIAVVCEPEKDWYKRIDGDYQRFQIVIEGGKKTLKTSSGQKLVFADEVWIEAKGPGHKKAGREVWNGRSVSKIEKKEGTGCYLFLGEHFSKKHAESVFQIKQPQPYESDLIKAALRGLESTLEAYRSETVNRNLGKQHFGYQGYEDAMKKGVLPLWYREKEGVLYLSMAQIGRIAYHSTMKDIAAGYEPCTDRAHLCPACVAFGMVGRESIGSRIRITDALMSEGQDPHTKYETLIELGTPHPSYLPFYSTGRKGYDDQEARIRGRKFYWHNPSAATDPSVYKACNNEKTKRNSTMELIDSGVTFSFKIYYDALTQKQIDMLKWVVTLGANDSDCMYKIGHGKPIGLGSCKIRILKQMERVYAGGSYEYRERNDLVAELPEMMDKAAWDEVEKITAFHACNSIPVKYPYILSRGNEPRPINTAASHNWFSCFKDSNDVLPDIEDIAKDEKRLTAYEHVGFVVGKIYHGRVVGYNDKKTQACVRLDGGREAKVFFRDARAEFGAIDQKLKRNTEIDVVYKGKNDKGFDWWIPRQ